MAGTLWRIIDLWEVRSSFRKDYHHSSWDRSEGRLAIMMFFRRRPLSSNYKPSHQNRREHINFRDIREIWTRIKRTDVWIWQIHLRSSKLFFCKPSLNIRIDLYCVVSIYWFSKCLCLNFLQLFYFLSKLVGYLHRMEQTHLKPVHWYQILRQGYFAINYINGIN